MKVLFLTMIKIDTLDERGIYTDLLYKFYEEGHEIFVVCPTERREKKNTSLVKNSNVQVLKVKTLNLQKTNIIEKGLGAIAMEYQFLAGIKKYFPYIKFDLVLYSTPPVTFSKVIRFIKNRDAAFCYLLLKDIFPQNAVDMQMIRSGSLLHHFFQKKEKKLYTVSDKIGCMSEANRQYILKHNPWIQSSSIEVNPNSLKPLKIAPNEELKIRTRQKYGIPVDSKVLIYGGNLGVPQGIDFLLETILNSQQLKKIYFLIVGSGTEFKKIQNWFAKVKPANAKLMAGMQKNEYDLLLAACDVGMVFLNKNFSIPNFPSRLLSYLENKMPVIAATDTATDIGVVVQEAGCGFWVHSGDHQQMQKRIIRLISDDSAFGVMQENAYKLLTEKYTVNQSYQLIFTAANV